MHFVLNISLKCKTNSRRRLLITIVLQRNQLINIQLKSGYLFVSTMGSKFQLDGCFLICFNQGEAFTPLSINNFNIFASCLKSRNYLYDRNLNYMGIDMSKHIISLQVVSTLKCQNSTFQIICSIPTLSLFILTYKSIIELILSLGDNARYSW